MKFSTSIAFAAFAARTQAQLQLNSVTYTGLGCPSGTASITPDRAGTDLLVLFSAFTMELPGMGTKDCALHIDVSGVPSGKLPVFTIMARGFLVLSEGSMATYRATGFWSHDPQSTLFTAKKEFKGDLTDNVFQLGPVKLVNANGGSGCGVQHDVFNLNFAVSVMGYESLAHIDNLDIGVALAPC